MEPWIEDIYYIRDKLPNLHKNLFFKRQKKEFYSDIENLLTYSDDMDVFEIRIEIAKIIASIGDAHTSVNFPVKLLCPIEFYWFSDGIYVTRTTTEYEEILFSKVTHISGIEISKVIDMVSRIISRENVYLLHGLLPKYLPAIEILFDLNIAENIDMLELQCTLISGENKTVNIKALSPNEARQKLVNNADLVENTLPLYRRNPNQLYWYEYLSEYETIYFKYNACREREELDFKSFCSKLLSDIETKNPKTLVVDLRNNKGGDSTLLETFIEEITRNPVLNRKGALFVIVGRDTFSSALLNAFSLKKNTESIIVGEPTGGAPNCYGEVERMHLKDLDIVISYSTKYYKLVDNDIQPSLIPDVVFEVSIDDYMNNIDPSMEYIISNYV